MLRLTQENDRVMSVYDSAASGRIVAVFFTLLGVLLVVFSYPLLPDGNSFITGLIIALVGCIIFFTKKSYTLNILTQVALQLTFDVFTKGAWRHVSLTVLFWSYGGIGK